MRRKRCQRLRNQCILNLSTFRIERYRLFFIGYPNPIWILHRCSWWPGAYLAPGHLVGRCKSGVSQREIKQYLMAVHSAINMLLLCESCHSCHNWVSMVVIKIPCLHGTRIPVGSKAPLIARFMGSTWGPSGADRTQMDPMLAPWTLLSGMIWAGWRITGPDHRKSTI